jgi:hypothetical protein
MFLTSFDCHTKGHIYRVTVSTKRNIYKLDDPLLKQLNLENIYSQKMISKVKLTKEDGHFRDNEITQHYTI